MKKQSLQQKKIEKAVEILETAYIQGDNVRIENAVHGNTIIIDNNAIPLFRRLITEKKTTLPVNEMSELRCCDYPISSKVHCDHFWYSGFYPVDEEHSSKLKQDFGCTCTGKIEPLTQAQILQTSLRGCASHSSANPEKKTGEKDPQSRQRTSRRNIFRRNTLWGTRAKPVLIFGYPSVY